MDQLLKTLQQLKTIVADPGYTKRSRELILNTLQPRGPVTMWRIVLENIQVGTALALAGVLVFLVVGGFTFLNILSPLRLSSLDPAGLRAEAEAIDIQIQLTDLNYSQPGAQAAAESTPAFTTEGNVGPESSKGEASEPVKEETAPPQPIGIDEALGKLSE